MIFPGICPVDIPWHLFRDVVACCCLHRVQYCPALTYALGVVAAPVAGCSSANPAAIVTWVSIGARPSTSVTVTGLPTMTSGSLYCGFLRATGYQNVYAYSTKCVTPFRTCYACLLAGFLPFSACSS